MVDIFLVYSFQPQGQLFGMIVRVLLIFLVDQLGFVWRVPYSCSISMVFPHIHESMGGGGVERRQVFVLSLCRSQRAAHAPIVWGSWACLT